MTQFWQEKTQGWIHDENNIKGFFGEFRFLSNFHPCIIEFEGIVFPSVENAYMAAKTLDIEDRKRISTISAASAKSLGRIVKLRDDWEEVKVDIMYNLLKQKFKPYTDCYRMLTATGNKYLEETNYWNDTFWGVCKGIGENTLGKLLMRVRSEL